MRVSVFLRIVGVLCVSPAAAALHYDPPALFDTSYGERVPGSTEAVGLWRASSGWKVSKDRQCRRRRRRAWR